MYVNFNILNQLGSPSLNSNTFANRPAAGQVGRLFISTDTLAIYRDNGTSWDQIGGGAGISGSGTAGQVTYWDGTSSVTGESAFTYDAVTNDLRVNGNIALNTAAVGWSTVRAFQSNTSSFAGSNVGNGYYLTTNTYYDGANWKYITTGTASRLDVAGNEYIFGQALSGSAGSNATFILGLHLDSSNRLGVNASPSSWQSVYKVVQLPYGASFYSNDSATTVGLTSNAYYDTGASWQRFITGTAARYEMNNNTHAWYIAASGSGAITYTQAITLFSTGNLVIGSTTDGGQRLQVSGDALINTVTVGNGFGSIFTNTCLGAGSMTQGTGNNNTAIGYNTFRNATNASGVVAVGSQAALSVTTGINNIAVGRDALYSISVGNYNIGLGYQAGRYAISTSTNNTSSTSSIYIGQGTKAGANGNTNEIVIGNNTVGIGSNTTIIGNSSTITSAIYGNLLLGTTTIDGAKLYVNGSTKLNGTIRIDSQLSATAGGASGQHLIINCDGTTYKIALLNN